MTRRGRTLTDRAGRTPVIVPVSAGRVAALIITLVIGVAAGCSEPKGQVSHPELRGELLEMRNADQAERRGEEPWLTENDRARTERLKEIIDEYGWPTPEMVGKDGATAAWLIAQHSDLDVAFQERALALMKDAATRGDADPTEVAYLVDRVAINKGQRQTYGTQAGCADGGAAPKPLVDPENVDVRRAAVGLEPLDDYLAEMEKVCADEIEDGPTE